MGDRTTAALVIDNLTLQDVGDTLLSGLTDDDRVEVFAAPTAAGYEIRKVPSAGVQIESVLQLLNVIVLHDQLIVDASAMESWEDAGTFFLPLRSEHVVVAKPFSEAIGDWRPLRDYAQEALCFSPQLASDFAAYRASWKPNGPQSPVFSTLLWGTAGMLARSQFLKAPFLGHPSRGRLIELGALGAIRPSAMDVVHRFISTERVKFFDRINGGGSTRIAELRLPPIALEVVAEAADATQLIPTAIHLRSKYRNLREWIGEFQIALDSSPEEAAKRKGAMEAAAADISKLFLGPWWKNLTIDVSLGLDLPKIAHKRSFSVGDIVEKLAPWTIRSAVTRMVKQPWNHPSLDRLFEMLDGASPKLRAQITRHFTGTREG